MLASTGNDVPGRQRSLPTLIPGSRGIVRRAARLSRARGTASCKGGLATLWVKGNGRNDHSGFRAHFIEDVATAVRPSLIVWSPSHGRKSHQTAQRCVAASRRVPDAPKPGWIFGAGSGIRTRGEFFGSTEPFYRLQLWTWCHYGAEIPLRSLLSILSIDGRVDRCVEPVGRMALHVFCDV